MKLIDIIKTLNPKPVTGYEHSSHILYSDIVLACKKLGQDNHHYINSLLEKLAEENVIKIVYLTAPGFEDMISGVILNN